jgi:hypothetical protein
MATLVFDTLRVGFPSAEVHVCINAEPDLAVVVREEILKLLPEAIITEAQTIHHEWIEKLIRDQTEPFYLVDTDVIFYRRFEQYSFTEALAGWRIPEWLDAFSGCITRARLHPSLLYVNPVKVMGQLASVYGAVPETRFTPTVNPFHPLCLPFKGRMYFHDTLSLLYHAIGGTAFTDVQKDAYCHFNFGTIPDVVMGRLPKLEAQAISIRRLDILSNYACGFGAWREQEEYYANHPPL